MKTRWHIHERGETLVLARRLPVQMDVCAETVLPDANRLKVAHQVRQDMWRALQSLRGFAPVVEVTRTAGGLHVRAGGQVDGAVPATAKEDIESVLNDPRKRDRWVRHAARKPVISSNEGRAGPRGGAHPPPVVPEARLRRDGRWAAQPGTDAGQESDHRIVETARQEAASSGGQP